MENNHKIYGDVVSVPGPRPDVYTKAEVDAFNQELKNQKANKSNVYTKTEVDALNVGMNLKKADKENGRLY